MTIHSPTANQHYRPDIDGLRAIAVLSVILFHINKEFIPGGFVGVDIFFVISGFLISRNILQDLEGGQFSIVDFYRRRVKRIASPMLVVVGVTLVVAQIVLLPENAKSTAVSALWSLLSLSNVYFWLNQDSGYFAAASGEIPLLHLWSPWGRETVLHRVAFVINRYLSTFSCQVIFIGIRCHCTSLLSSW